MALKTTDYYVKRTNDTLKNAYAYIIKCETDRVSGYALIGIFKNRDDAQNLSVEPYEVKRVNFIVDRTENDRVVAYRTAKLPLTERVWNDETKQFEDKIIDKMFMDWDDDIV